MGTRSLHIEDYMKKEKSFKQLIFVLNKCDLVPNWVTAGWVATLSKVCPTLAMHASITNSYGKGALIQLLRQFGQLHSDKMQISVGFIGYPNVGKSSIINTLKASKVCKTAPVPGETKVWQYVTLMRRIYLVDCPGVVYPTGDSEAEIVLKGVVRVEKIKTPEDYIEALLQRARPEYICRQYGIEEFDTTDHTKFLENLAKRMGRLLKGGEPDIRTMALMVLHDWQCGKIPYYARPPDRREEEAKEGEDKGASLDGLKSGESDQKQTDLALENAQDDLADIQPADGFFNKEDLTDPKHRKKSSKATAAEDADPKSEEDEQDGDEDDATLTWDDLTSQDAPEPETEPEAKKPGAKKDRKRRRVAEPVADAPADEESAADKPTTKKKKTSKPWSGTTKATAKTEQEKQPPADKKAAAPVAPEQSAFPTVPEFIKSKKFAGAKAGYVFKKDKKGVGYYVDVNAPAEKKTKKKKKAANKNTDQQADQQIATAPSPAVASGRTSSKKKSDKKEKHPDHPTLAKLKKEKRDAAKKDRMEKKKAAEDYEPEDEGKYKKQVKEPRKTNNKMKIGDHYYNEVNTKNRRRGKAPQKPT